jgi:hypothetical protein
MLHEAAGFERNGFVRIEHIASTCVPRPLQHGGVASFGMEMGFAHHPWRKLHLNNIDARLCRVSIDDRRLETQTVGFIHPLQVFRSDAFDRLGSRRSLLSENRGIGQQQSDSQRRHTKSSQSQSIPCGFHAGDPNRKLRRGTNTSD